MTKEEVKKLVERYPYLLPYNVWTGNVPEDYDYSYIFPLEIPDGWMKLFLQMCEDIRQPLIDANYLDKFRFTQVKEKYNELRCYHCGAPQSVIDIIDKYEQMARYICTRCGKPATYETQGYFESFCEDCWKDCARHERVKRLDFTPYFRRTIYQNGNKREEIVSFENEWKRYLKALGDLDSKNGGD